MDGRLFGVNGGGGAGSSWQLAAETRYVYDGMRVIQERDSNNVPTVSYTRGTDLSGSLEGAGGIGGLLARSHGYSSGNWTTHNFYHADGNGNITYLVNSSQTLAASYRYDPYGNTLSASGALADANAYRFSSKEWLATPALYYYGCRFYDPNVQRWLNRDPVGEEGGLNLYEFAANDPLAFVDKNGRDWWPPSKWPWPGGKKKPKPQPKPKPKPPKTPTVYCPPWVTDPVCKNLLNEVGAKVPNCQLDGDPYDTFVSVCDCITPDAPGRQISVAKCAKDMTDMYRKACP